MSWGMGPAYGTEKWQSGLIPPTPILLIQTGGLSDLLERPTWGTTTGWGYTILGLEWELQLAPSVAGALVPLNLFPRQANQVHLALNKPSNRHSAQLWAGLWDLFGCIKGRF